MSDLRPFGPLPPGRQSDAGFDTLMDYYLSFNDAFVRSTRCCCYSALTDTDRSQFHSFHVHKEQPLIELSKVRWPCWTGL